MSKGGGKQSTTQVQSVDPEFKERALDVYSRAEAVADQGYTPYTGGQAYEDYARRTVAGLTPAQEATAFELLQMRNQAQPAIREAMGYTRDAMPDFGAANAAFYRPQFGEAQGLVRGTSAVPSVTEAQALTRGAVRPGEYGEARDVVRAALAQPGYAEAQQFARTGAQYQPSAISAGMAAYQNPYESDVVQTALSDIERSRQLALQQGAAQATRARAYGGSRQAVAEAETNRAALEQAARTSAQLRAQGFETAGRMAAQDVGYGLQGAQQRLAAAQQLGALTQAQQAGMFGGARDLGALTQAEQTGVYTGAGQIGQLGVAGTQSELARAGMLGGFEQAQAQAAAQEAQQRAAMAQATSQANLARGAQLAGLGVTGQRAATEGAQAAFNAQEAIRLAQQQRMTAAEEAFMREQGEPMRDLQILQQALGFFPNPMTTTATQRQTLGPLDIISRLGGTAASGAQSYYLLCWVARAVYGAENPRWLMFREWLLEDAPKWFVHLYIRHGAAFADWLEGKDSLKAMIRRFMDGRIAKKFGG